MNLARWLFKPKWQDKNPEIRRTAVTSEPDPELIAALPDLVRSDPDAQVRLAALKRLNDYEAWRERSTGDADADVRRVARGVYLTLLCANDAKAPALPRRIAELETLGADEVEKVAVQATDRDLRAAALQRVTRPALLIDRTIGDADPALRLAVLERISDTAALERIAERARKTDKAVSRRARELLDAQRIGSGDAEAIAGKARQLCERMEALMRAPDADDATHATIHREWQALGNGIPTELIARYCGADALVRQTRINVSNPPAPAPAAAVESDIAPVTPTDTSPVPVAPPPLSADMLASKARFEAAVANAAAEAQREREQRRLHLQEIETLAEHYASQLDGGTMSAARVTHVRIAALQELAGPLPPALQGRLAPLHAQYAELKQHQHWAHRQRREALCDEIEGLAQSGLHPDALATRVREARDEWQRLDAAEGMAEKAESGLTRRFQGLCQRALKPAKHYFDKRDELRRAHTETVERLLASATALPAEIDDWKAAIALRRELGEALRSLDAVDPRVRTALARRLKEAMSVLDPRIEAHLDAIEKAKKRLIERAALLAQQSDGRSLARDAKELQQQWTAVGNGRRGSDQRLWNEFRGAIDTAFGKLDSARKERDAQTATAKSNAEHLIAQLDALPDVAANDTDTAKAALRDIDARWQELAVNERSLEQRYRQGREAVTAVLRDAARRQHLSRYTQALTKYALLRALESDPQAATKVESAWAESGPAADEFEPALATRYALARSPQPANGEADENSARDLLVEIEFLGGLETPADDRSRRMNIQVQRLASRMRDRAALTPEAELTALLCAWFAQAPQSADIEARFVLAAQAAIAALP